MRRVETCPVAEASASLSSCASCGSPQACECGGLQTSWSHARDRLRSTVVKGRIVTAYASSVEPWMNVYVDESGTPELDLKKPHVGRYYVAVAVFVDEQQDRQAEDLLEVVAAKLCGGGEIKSSKIGPDHDRRLRFLEAVQEVDFGYFALAVDKSLVYGDSGLRFKATFHKFFSRLLQGQFGYSGGGLRVCSDRYGDSLFMESLDRYLAETVRPHLFYGYEHRSLRSESCRLIELADLVAGSLVYWLDPDRASLYRSAFETCSLRRRQASWPGHCLRERKGVRCRHHLTLVSRKRPLGGRSSSFRSWTQAPMPRTQ